jgi:isopropylmalate/homocitrate/citramalate synthase
MKKAFVDCRRNGQSIRVYDFGLPDTLGPTVPPERKELIDQAKTALTNERLAFPPYDDIEFDVRYP